MEVYLLILFLLAPEFVKGESPTMAPQCPDKWIPYKNSCYEFIQRSRSVRPLTWEDARIYCRALDGDLVSIGDRSESEFINEQLRSFVSDVYWLGLKRTSSGDNAKGWAWSDGTLLNFSKWAHDEPNNWQNNENCAEIFSNSGYWNDVNCMHPRLSMCERKKGLPFPTLPTPPNITTTQSELKCDEGWKAFGKSCYKLSKIKASWQRSKSECWDLGGHLVKIDDKAEQDFLYGEIWNLWNSRFWIGLSDPKGDNNWQWIYDNSTLNYTNWFTDEPNGRGTEKCVEMYGGRLATFWNDNSCSFNAQYICEKQEGKNECPDDWSMFEDNCYQFNLAESQLKNWNAAEKACKSVGDFSSLASIGSQAEQDFLTKQVSSVAESSVWIGLNDRQSENVFKWSDNSKVDYQNWEDNNRGNRAWKDCTVLMGMKTDGAWTTERCSETRRYICKRKRGMFNCDEPLGMENGNILDNQITAKIIAPSATGPLKSRLGSNGTWCPSEDESDYLQIDLGSTYKITKIVINGSATSFCVQYGNDGKTYKSYGREDSIVCEELSSKRLEKPHILPNLRPFVGRYVRITPNRCIQLELYGCLSENSVTGSSWSEIPSTKYTYQLNHLSLSWTAARSYCLEQNADLISMSSQTVVDYMNTRLSTQRPYAWWIGLNDRDHSSKYYWTDSSPVNYVGWVGYISSYGSLDCVQYRKYQSSWHTANCNERKPFICMKKEPSPDESTDGIYGNVGNGATGVWMSSATHYWPLSNVDDGKVWGTTDGQAFGSINVISGVKNKSESALQFSKSGMYIDVSFEEDDCLTFPDTCPQKKLTLSFMAMFDKTAANWPNVPLLDSLGGNAQNSTGISVTVNQKQLWFVVSYVDLFWMISVPIQGDEVWRHYALTCSQRLIQVFVNGKPVGSRAYRPTSRKRIYSKNLKRKFHIGLQSNSKVSSGAFGLAMLAFWEGTISEKDIRAIYKTEFGWCPNGWIAFGMSCYRFSTDTLGRTVARARCQFLGGDLATISTPIEQAMITRQVKTLSWIGLQSTERRSRRSPRRRIVSRQRMFGSLGWPSRRRTVTTNKLNFLWDNRSPVMYTNWKPFAFRYRSSSPCVSVQGLTGLWGLSSCYSSISSICEKEKDETKPASNITVVDVSKFTRVCQYSSTLLNCPTGSVIKIQRGFWGRKQRDVCRFVSIIDCGLDTVLTVTKKLRQQCDGSWSCKVEASNDPKHFGNPCLGVYKYLEVNYTCVHPEKIKESPCPPGWVRSKHGGIACYRLIQSKKTWSDAEKYCQRYGAKLLSISENSEQVLATSLMERVWNTDVWIGLSFDNTTNTYKWSDESPVKWTNWALGNPRGRWSKDYCVYMNLERTTQDLMYWKVGKCTEEKLFICKKKLFSAPVPTKSTSTTRGSCRLGWTLFNNKCYRHYKNSVSWERARSNCRLYYVSGNLAVITSPEVNDFLTKFANTTVWIGLEGRGVYRGHVWNDGTPVSYTNWDKGQPNSYNGREACTQLYGEVGYWEDVNCYDTKTYICERLPSAIFIPTSVAPTFASPSRCKDDWTLFSDMCYLISDDKNSSTYKSWNEAELSCKKLGGHLASVTSREEKDFLSTLTRSKLVYSFWIGLHDMDGESLYQWTDGTGYGKFVYWGNGEPNNYHGQEDCVAMLRTSGKWNDNHCSSKKPFICKSKTEDASKIAVLKPATKVVKDGYCAPGWVANGQFCYEFHTDDTDYKSWIDAKNTCERGTNSSSVGELASIGNEIEQAFITLNLKGAKVPLWIGLNNLHYTSSYFWSDNSPSNYFNWNKGQPSVGWSRCVEISPFKRDAGKWSSNACSTKRGYICKTAAKNAPVVLATTIPPGITPKTTEPPSFKCSKEYFQYDESCYKFVNSPKTFDQARDACRKESAELISVETEFEQAVLVFLMERNLGSVWIGLSKEPYSALKFTDLSPAHYSYWGAGQPNRPLDQRTCIQANVSGYHVGRWDDVDCNTKNPFICEVYHGEEKITLEENSTCEAGWKKYKKNCFKYFAQYKSWPSARYNCLNIGADLMSIADDLEQDFTMFYFSNKPRTWLWLGLHDRSYEGGYEWSDRSPLTYTNWKDNQPNDVGQSQNCVLMDSRDGRWLDWRCASLYSFVCKKPLECFSPISLSKDMITISNAIAANLSVQQAILDDNSLANEAWCPNTITTPRIQIDLFDLVKITSITTKGRVARFSSQFFKSFSVEFTTDGSTWQTYTQRGIKVNFFANTDGFNAVTKSLDPPIVASSIAVLPTVRKGVLPCMKLSLTGCDFVCQAPLGMRNGKILTNSIMASSANYPKNAPESARPNMPGWCAKTNDKQQWIQVDFGRTNLVTKIRTFGNTEDSYVKSYKIQFSADGIIWVDYTQYGSVRTFGGNLHAGHPMTHYLSNAFQAKLVRIVPISWNNNICMRFELFGCDKDCDVPLIQKGDNEISEVKFASSDPKSNPKDAAMNSKKAWCTKGKGQYLEVDFGRRVQLKHIATTGSPLNYGEPRRVVTFTLEFYRDNKWKKYIVDNSVQYIVSGNFNNSAELSKSSFSSGRRGNGIIAKKVRIYPKEFTPAGACLRVEFYGCLAAAEIIPTTPSKSQIKLNVSIRILNFIWTDLFYDQTSEEFKQTKAIITKSVTDVYEDNVDSQEGEALRDVKMKRLRKGSIIADLVLVFNPRFATNENISKPLVDAVKSGKIGNLIVDKNYIVIGKRESLHSGNSESKTMSTGAIAGIVVAVLLVLLLVVAIGIYLRRKRSNLYGPKQFNNPILYSTANTDEFYVE